MVVLAAPLMDVVDIRLFVVFHFCLCWAGVCVRSGIVCGFCICFIGSHQPMGWWVGGVCRCSPYAACRALLWAQRERDKKPSAQRAHYRKVNRNAYKPTMVSDCWFASVVGISVFDLRSPAIVTKCNHFPIVTILHTPHRIRARHV